MTQNKPRHRAAATAPGAVKSLRAIASGAGATVIAPVKTGASNLAGSSLGGGYEGSQRQRRLFGFRPSETSVNSLLTFAGSTLRARARYLVRNNAYAKKAQRVFVTNLAGTGIRPIPQAEDENIKTAISTLWADWADEADSDGLTDLYGLQVLAARAVFEAGECFIRYRPRFARDGLCVPLQLQLLESEFCPYELNFVAANGNLVKSGIEFDKIGRRAAYYFWRTHPGESLISVLQTGYTRVPAEEVLHLFEPQRPGQVRGVSWLAAAIVRAWLLDSYDDAELARKQTAALFAGFITRPDNSADDPPLAGQDQLAAGTRDTSLDADSEVAAGLTPGMMQVLLQGEDVKFSQPADVGPNYEAFEYRALLALCAAMDMPYSNVTGDFSKANYSSERARQLDMRAAIKPLQKTVMVFQMCKPVYRRFVSDAVVAGALPVSASAFARTPRAFTRAVWIPPRLEWVDPKKDVDAEINAIRAGLESRESAVLARGSTLDEVDAASARSNESADKHGLVLDSDPRLTNKRGSGAPPELASPPAAEDAQQSQDDASEAGNDEEQDVEQQGVA